MQGDGVDINVVNEGAALENSGVAHADILTAFVDAVVKENRNDIASARDTVESVMGWEALVDSACIIGNFQRMNRIADATGIELDAPVQAASDGIKTQLGLDKFATAANTKPASRIAKFLGKILLPIAVRFMPSPPQQKK
jgi:hypothetical protein